MTQNKIRAWHMENDTQIYTEDNGVSGRKVKTGNSCPNCAHKWNAIAYVNSWGIQCPVCYHSSMTIQWPNEA